MLTSLMLRKVAEKTFRHFCNLANDHPDIQFIAVSHSDPEHTDEWLISVGGYGDVKVTTDPEREMYGQWGLGISGWGAVLSPSGIADTISLAIAEGIKNKPTKSGNRWQTAGSFAIDEGGIVRWAHISASAGDISKFADGLKALKEKAGKGESNEPAEPKKQEEAIRQEDVEDDLPSDPNFAIE